MRFLADESCDFGVVRALSAAGHDVLAVALTHQGASDETVIGLAGRERRILLTEDRDFGQLVFAGGLPSPGVIYMRFPARTRELVAAAVTELIAQVGDNLADAFVVLQPGRARITRRL